MDGGDGETRPSESRRARVAAVALGVAVGALVCEALLRLLGVTYPVFGCADSVTGTALAPGAAGWYRYEGEAFVRINRAGLRDRERTLRKAPGTARIAVFGDAYTEARQVPLEASFPALLEARLDGRSASPVEVLNFGVTGYGTASALLRLRDRGWAFEPDVVVLAFLSGNDVRENSRRLSGRRHIPYFELVADRLVLDGSFRESPTWRRLWRFDRLGLSPCINRSALLQLVKEASRPRPRRPPFDPLRPWREPGDDLEVYAPPATADWREAWAITQELIASFHRESAEHGATFILVSLDNAIQVHPEAAVRDRFRAELGLEDELYPERRLAAFCAARGIPYVALAPALQRLAEREGVFLHGFDARRPGIGHWNRLGHRAAADLLAEALAPYLGSPPGGP